MAKSEAPAKGYVRVKFLKFVGQHQPGDIVDVTESHAEHLLTSTPVNMGEGKIEHHQKAILLEHAEKMEHAPVDIRKMSSKELADLGKRNVVPTPKDPAFEARLAQMQNGKKVNAPAVLDEKANEPDEDTPEWVPGSEDEKEAKAPESEAGTELEEGQATAGEGEAAADGKGSKKKATGPKKTAPKK